MSKFVYMLRVALELGGGGGGVSQPHWLKAWVKNTLGGVRVNSVGVS